MFRVCNYRWTSLARRRQLLRRVFSPISILDNVKCTNCKLISIRDVGHTYIAGNDSSTRTAQRNNDKCVNGMEKLFVDCAFRNEPIDVCGLWCVCCGWATINIKLIYINFESKYFPILCHYLCALAHVAGPALRWATAPISGARQRSIQWPNLLFLNRLTHNIVHGGLCSGV